MKSGSLAPSLLAVALIDAARQPGFGRTRRGWFRK
jgi:hypothetical protein